MLRNRIGYCFLLAAAVLFHIFFVGYLSFYILAFLLALPVLSFALTVPAAARMRIFLEPAAGSAEKKQEAVFRIRLANRFFLPVACVKLRLCSVNSLCGRPVRETLTFPADAGRDTAVEYRVCPEYAGKITVSLRYAGCCDFLGLFSFRRKLDQAAEVFVPPAVFPLDVRLRPPSTVPESETYSTVKPGDDPSEVFDIRPYREGDRLRSIHWKLSARLGKLMTREFSLPLDCSVLLVLELLAPGPAELEAVLETAASVSHFLAANRIPHRIEWYDALREEYRGEPVADDDGLALVLRSVLSSGGYRDRAYACAFRDGLETPVRPGSRLICITGSLTEEIVSLCRKAGGATVLCADGEQDPAGRKLAGDLAAGGSGFVEVRPGKITESLSGLTI